MAVQNTIGDWKPFAVREQSRDDRRRAEPADAPASVGWSEEEMDYIAESSLSVPGQGDRPEDCGDHIPLKYCPSCGEPHALERVCGSRSCPSCNSVWMGDHAEKATVRLVAAREDEPDGVRRRLVHAVFSPPEGEIETTGQYERGKKEAQQLAKEHGIRGGVCIGHGFRVKEAVQERFRRLREEEVVDSGIWRWILQERSGDWRTAVYFSPHYHIIGLTTDFKANDPAGDDGWVSWRIRDVKRHSRRKVDPYEDIYGLTYYLLSHASYDPEDSRHSIRWFGSVSYNKFSPERLEDWKERQIRRMARKVRDESLPEEYEHRCDEDDCEGVLAPIMEASDHLQDPEWCDKIGSEKQRRLMVAVDWFRRDVMPPPGMQHPGSAAAADEVLEELVSRR